MQVLNKTWYLTDLIQSPWEPECAAHSEGKRLISQTALLQGLRSRNDPEHTWFGRIAIAFGVSVFSPWQELVISDGSM